MSTCDAFRCHAPVRLVGALVLLATLSSACRAQDIERVEPPLIDQQPFDLIVLTDEAGGDQVRILPLSFRTMPSSPDPAQKLEVVLERYQERRYEVAWKSISEILFFEQRIYDEANQKMDEKDFVTAFQNLSFLLKNYPSMPRLEELRQNFIFRSAIERFDRGELRQTLSALEELRETAPGFQATAVLNALSRVADSLVGEYQQQGKLGAAQILLNRLQEKYGSSIPVVEVWQGRLKTMALAKQDQALQLLEEGKYRQARQAAIEMTSIFPDLEGAQEILDQIGRLHPMVRVGVMQRSGNLDPSSLVDWSARRAGGLVHQCLFQFLETGSEGGQYRFSLGNYLLSDDRTQLILNLNQAERSSMDAFGLAQELLHRADPSDRLYDPSWAAIFDSVATRKANQVLVQLRQPKVLPHALMQWVLPTPLAENDGSAGAYQVTSNDESEAVFGLRDKSSDGRPVEIIEIFYDDPKEAVNDLLRGEIDILDQLYPADAKRLAADRRVRIGSYALPTSHMLIPVSDHPYLSNIKFRKALLYSTNREAMLSGELLDSSNWRDGRLISGPFPLGNGETDPLAYAYNLDIKPIPYSPQLARLLLLMASNELREAAEDRHEPIPKLEKLVVGCPDYEFARVAVQAMIQQWMNVGVAAEMVVLPSDQLHQPSGCDLIYVVSTMWEPATDIERLLGEHGIASTNDPFIIQALEQLRNCRNWREVRNVMQDMHQLIDYHLPVLPLWQVADRYAASPKVEGLEDHPVSLYQDVDQWRINLGALQTANR